MSHSFARATETEPSWHVQNRVLIGSLELNQVGNIFPWDFNYELIALCETAPICIAFYEHKSKCGQRSFQNRKPFDKIR